MSKLVLVVEDNLDNQKLVQLISRDEGYDCDVFDSAEDAFTALDQKSYGLILMDISLPGMDGKEATQKLRADPRFAELPILAVTAHAVSGEAEAILASGVDEIITKPIDDDLLSARLTHWLPLDGQEPSTTGILSRAPSAFSACRAS